MRSSIFLLGVALPAALALCPYAQQLADTKRTSMPMPHDHPTRDTSCSDSKKGVFYMNRIAPGTSKLYIANTDGSDERLLLGDKSVFEYHGSFSPDGKWISFTSERNGDGNSDIYRVRTDGSGLQELVASPAVEDGAVISPNGKFAAYVSTTNGYKANVWVVDLETGNKWNVTGTASALADPDSPDGYFKPAWSPDGQWIAFSSDRNTGWTGHGTQTFLGVTGWEHTQTLAIYAARPDGSDFRKIVGKDGWSLGSPKWSPDGKRIIYYEMTRENTWNSHRPESIDSANSSIVSIDFATGTDRRVEAQGAGVKIFPQYISENNVAYFLKGVKEGMYNTQGLYVNTSSVTLRSPCWSPDGKKVVYEKTEWNIRPMDKPLYSWDPEWEYRFTDVFPTLSRQNMLAMTQKQLGNSSVVKMNANGTNTQMVFNDMKTNFLNPTFVGEGLAGAFSPGWSTDGESIVVGVGFWFQTRATNGGWLIKAAANGSSYEVLTESKEDLSANSTALNSGFPSFSHDGKKVVYRVWGWNSTQGQKSQLGLRLLDLETRKTTVLTNEWDNLPSFSPDGSKILFTRKTSPSNYDVCTMNPDGTNIKVLTTSGANDAHAVWDHRNGNILYSSGMYGFQYECALYDQTFQPYGMIMQMEADGSNKKPLSDSIWEDSMPLFVTNEELENSPKF